MEQNNKKCARCGIVKPVFEFGYRKAAKDKIKSWCRICENASCREHYHKNREIMLVRMKIWRNENPDKANSCSDSWKKRNPAKVAVYLEKGRDRALKYAREYKKKNKKLIYAINKERKFRKTKCAPKWANRFFIQEAYALSKQRTLLTGFAWHVDHIIPLRGSNVCGLHCESNLQVILAIHNLEKGNKFNDFPNHSQATYMNDGGK